jgi:hypothetical protein
MPLNLPVFQRKIRLVDDNGLPTLEFHTWLSDFARAITTNDQGQQDIIDQIAEVVGLADDLDTAVTTAQTAADTAQAAAEGANSVASLTNSGTTGVTITATDAGANVTVTVSAHTRVYGDGTSVPVNGGSVTGLAYSTVYYIYYDDPTRAGGAVTYLATTSETTAAQTGDRHLVGVVTTPAAAAPPVNGDYVRAPGIGNIIP